MSEIAGISRWGTKSLKLDVTKIAAAAAALQTATFAVQNTVASVSGIAAATGFLPLAIDAIDFAYQSVLSTVASLVTDFLGTGFYFCDVWPQTLDINRAMLREGIARQEAYVQELQSQFFRQEIGAEKFEPQTVLDAQRLKVLGLQEDLEIAQAEVDLLNAKGQAALDRATILGELSPLAEIDPTITREHAFSDEEAQRLTTEVALARTKLAEVDDQLARETASLVALEANGEFNQVQLAGADGKVPVSRAKLALEEAKLLDLQRQDHFAKTDRPIDFPVSAFVDALAESFNDIGDVKRPKFGPTSVMTGVVVLVGADSLSDFVAACKALTSVFQLKKLARQTDLLERILALGVKDPLDTRRGMHQPPDWKNLSIAGLLGIEDQIDKIKAHMASLGLAVTPRALKIIRWTERRVAEIQKALAATTAAVAAVQAIANADLGVSYLVIAPADGTRVLETPLGPVTLPNATYGNAGFVEALRQAPGMPSFQYCAGFALLFGAPAPGIGTLLGTNYVDVAALLAGTVTSAQAQALTSAVKAAATSMSTQVGLLRAVFG